MTTASGRLNMRKTASKSAEVIAKIPQGATVTVLMEADDWWRVQYKNSTGWCAAEFLTKQENAAQFFVQPPAGMEVENQLAS